MFTIDQIKQAHSKVKSGADFPNYVQDVIKLGVEKYETYVSDGHSVYFGKAGFTTQSDAKYDALQIAPAGQKGQFQHDLKEHQQGITDYPTFCRISASFGVEKWVVDLQAMTCTYFDTEGNTMLIENIPTPVAYNPFIFNPDSLSRKRFILLYPLRLTINQFNKLRYL